MAGVMGMRHVAVSFFFQAEDVIRDHCVTGVQTCALPISTGPRMCTARGARCWSWAGSASLRSARATFTPAGSRSEERRVGKEWRCKWWPERFIKKEKRWSYVHGLEH